MAEHDYNVANASGSTVRTDINNALAAVVSLNSKATAPTTTFAHMLWMDTAPSGYSQAKVRNAGDSAWGMLFDDEGRIKTEDGTVSEPAHSFGNDTDSGGYWIAANKIGWATGGTFAMAIDSSQNVGIGTSSPAVGLHLSSSSTAEARVESTGGSTVVSSLINTSATWKFRNVAAGQLQLRDGTTTAFVVDTSTQEFKTVGPFTLQSDMTAGTGGVNKIWAGLYGVNDIVLDNTSPPAAGTITQASTWPDFDTLDFDASTDEQAHLVTALPEDYDGSNLIVDLMWAGTAGTLNTVRWLASGVCFDDDTVLGTAYPADAAVDDAMLAVSRLQITSITITPTTATNNDLLAIRITREGSHVNDTYASDARLTRVRVRYA